jgi:hypothetical protein
MELTWVGKACKDYGLTQCAAFRQLAFIVSTIRALRVLKISVAQSFLRRSWVRFQVENLVPRGVTFVWLSMSTGRKVSERDDVKYDLLGVLIFI